MGKSYFWWKKSYKYLIRLTIFNLFSRYYGGRGYYHAGPANIKNTEYGKTNIKYLTKRDTKDSEAKPQAYIYVPPSIKDIDYGKTSIKYLKKREAKPTVPRHIPIFELWAKKST